LFHLQPALVQRPSDHPLGLGPYLVGVVFYPPGLGVNLGMFLIARSESTRT